MIFLERMDGKRKGSQQKVRSANRNHSGDKSDMQLSNNAKTSYLEFLADSAEQIAHSIEMAGLRGQLNLAFQVAISRACGHQQKPFGQVINESRSGCFEG